MSDVLSKLPKSWRREKLKHVAAFRVSNVDKLTNEDEQPVRLCNYTDVYHRDFITPDLPLMEATATIAEIKRFHLEPGDVVITKDSESWDDIAVPALIEETAPDLVCGYHLAMIRGHENEIDGRFLFRCFQSGAIRSQLEIEAKGVTRYGLPNSAIGETLLPLPPLPLQRQIAAYLDRETARIDALVAEKEALLRLLEEKRASLISHAVTRGLNPKAKLKPSGIPWLGDVPVHWNLKPLRHLVSITSGQVDPRADEFRDWLLIAPNHIESGTGRIVGSETAADQGAISGKYLVRKGEVIYSKIRPELRKACIAPENCLCSADMYPMRTTAELLPEFLFYFLLGEAFSRLVILESMRVAMPKVNREMLAPCPLPVPPLQEQRAIAAECLRISSATDTVITDIQTSIHLLREKRTSLISAAVTGEMAVD